MNRLFDLDNVTLLALASRADTPKSILLALARSENDDFRKAVAKNANAAPVILSLLAFDDNDFIREQVASNPCTPSSILRLLAKDDTTWYRAGGPREWIKMAVAGNPNTPPDVLDLFVRFEFRNKDFSVNDDDIATIAAKNPQMPVDGLLRDMGNGARWAFKYIACNRNAPKDVLRELSLLKEDDLTEPDIDEKFLGLTLRRIMDNLAANPNTPEDVLAKEDLSLSIVAANPSTPVKVLKSMPYWNTGCFSDVAKALASNPNTPPDTLHRLSDFIFSDVTNLVAANPSTAKEDLARLSKKHDLTPSKDYSRSELRQYSLNRNNVASNPNTPIEILESMFAEGFRASIAANPNATAEMLAELAASEDDDVRLAAFTNERFSLLKELNISSGNITDFLLGIFPLKGDQSDDQILSETLQFIETMSALALRDDAPDSYLNYIIEKCDTPLRALAAKSRALTQRGIAGLSRDISKTVRREIASRTDLHIDVLEALINDRERSVSRVAKDNYIENTAIEQVYRLDDFESPKNTAEDPSADPRKLKDISKTSKDSQVLSLLAKNPSTPMDVLMQFASEGRFIRSLAANPNLTEDLADLITQKMTGDERYILLCNPSTPIRYLEAFSNPASDNRWQRAIASNPNATPELLDKFAHSGSAFLRSLAAANNSVSENTLRLLSDDADPMVRRRVAENPKTGAGILSALLLDHEEQIRFAALENPNSIRLDNRDEYLSQGTLSTKLNDASSLQTEAKRILELASDNELVVRIAAKSNLKYPLASILEQLPAHLLFHSDGCNSSVELGKIVLDFNDVENRLALAGREDLPDWLQAALSKDPEPLVRRTLASNKNVHPSVLESMFSSSDLNILKALASNPSAPSLIMEKLATIENDGIVSSLSDNPSITPKALSQLLQNKSRSIFSGYHLAGNPETHPDLLDVIAKADRPPYCALEVLASNPSIPVETLTMLANNNGPKIRARIAQNPSTPEELLYEMSEDESYEVRCGVAKNPSLSEELCIKLFTESASEYRVSSEAFQWIADNGTPYARYRLASAYNVPEECLIQLADDSDPEIRRAVSKNRKTPALIKERLLAEGSENCAKNQFELRKDRERKENTYSREENEPYLYLTRNPNTPGIVLSLLANRPDSRAYWDILSHPNTPHNILLKHLNEEGGSSSLASRLDISKEMLSRLSKDERGSVRAAVAKNINTPEETLKHLVKDKDGEISKKAAQNPSISIEFLTDLAQSPEYWIRESIVGNPNITPKILDTLANDSDELVRTKVADSNKTRPETLTRLSKDQSANVRLSVASNLNTPPEALALLSRDTSAGVRSMALGNSNLQFANHFEIRFHRG